MLYIIQMKHFIIATDKVHKEKNKLKDISYFKTKL